MSSRSLALLLCALSFARSSFAQTPSDQIAGRVVSATDSHPLPHARVTLFDTTSGRLAATASTDESGRFHFDPVPSGKYRLAGNAAGYVAAGYLAHGQYSTAIVTGAGLPIGALELRLTPTAAIQGSVLDDNNDPVQRALVQLYREDLTAPTRVTRDRAAQAEEDGSFEFDHLAPGRYFVSATGTPWYAVPAPVEPDNMPLPYRAAVAPGLDVAYPTIFYPHALDSAEATPINLQGGEQLHLNMQLHAQRALTLTLRLPPVQDANQRNQRFPQLTRSVFGIDEPVNSYSDGTNETRRITGLPPGRYNLQEMSNGSAFPAASRALDLATSSITMDMPPAGDLANVSATVHAADGASLSSLQLTLRAPHTNLIAGMRITEKGTAELQNIPRGDYSLIVDGRRRMHVTRVVVDGKASPDRHLHVIAPGDIAIEVTVSSTEVQVEGFAKHDGKAAAASLAILVPAGADTDADLFRRDQTDLDGSFAFADVLPGNYILIALDDAWELPWTDLPTLAPYLVHGVPVAIPATGSSHIKLPEAVITQPR